MSQKDGFDFLQGERVDAELVRGLERKGAGAGGIRVRDGFERRAGRRILVRRSSVHAFTTVVIAFLLVVTWILALPRAAAEDDTNATLIVDDNHVQCPQAHYTKIQDAVDAAKI